MSKVQVLPLWTLSFTRNLVSAMNGVMDKFRCNLCRRLKFVRLACGSLMAMIILPAAAQEKGFISPSDFQEKSDILPRDVQGKGDKTKENAIKTVPRPAGEKLKFFITQLVPGRLNLKQLSSRYQSYLSVTDDKYKSQTTQSILYGMRLSDAALASLAKDVEALNGATMDLEKMARILKMQPAIFKQLLSMRALANKKQWDQVFNLLLSAHHVGTSKMSAKSSEEIRTLIEVQCWMSDMEKCATVLTHHFSKAAATELNEFRLCVAYLEQVNRLVTANPNDKRLAAMARHLSKMKTVLNLPTNQFMTSQHVKQLRDICNEHQKQMISISDLQQ